MKAILQEPITVLPLKGSKTRRLISINLSGVPMRKWVRVMENWRQFFKRHNEINGKITEAS
jgi:hypothetical protein